MDLEDFKHGGTNITSLRLVNLDSPVLQQLVRDWSMDPAANIGDMFGGEIVSGYSFAGISNVFQAPPHSSLSGSGSKPQSSALLPEYKLQDEVFSPDEGSKFAAAAAAAPTSLPMVNFTNMPVSGRWCR